MELYTMMFILGLIMVLIISRVFSEDLDKKPEGNINSDIENYNNLIKKMQNRIDNLEDCMIQLIMKQQKGKVNGKESKRSR